MLISLVAMAGLQVQFMVSNLAKHTPSVPEVRLVLVDSGPIAASNMDRRCEVRLNQEYVRAFSEEQLAGIVGHELAHCSLKHQHLKDLAKTTIDYQPLSWQYEYEADRLGVAIAHDAGYSTTQFEQWLASLPEDIEHPSGLARIKALSGGAQEYPEIVRVNQATATTMVVENGRVILR